MEIFDTLKKHTQFLQRLIFCKVPYLRRLVDNLNLRELRDDDQLSVATGQQVRQLYADVRSGPARQLRHHLHPEPLQEKAASNRVFLCGRCALSHTTIRAVM